MILGVELENSSLTRKFASDTKSRMSRLQYANKPLVKTRIFGKKLYLLCKIGNMLSFPIRRFAFILVMIMFMLWGLTWWMLLPVIVILVKSIESSATMEFMLRLALRKAKYKGAIRSLDNDKIVEVFVE